MDAEQEVTQRTLAWDAAIACNDVAAMSSYMSDDWICVGETGISKKQNFLSWIACGDLVHTIMSSDELQVRLYGDTAIVVNRGTSAGTYKQAPFSLYEWSSNVFIRQNGVWMCVHTQLTLVKQ
jgi:ketosteroid isomerase-like protein